MRCGALRRQQAVQLLSGAFAGLHRCFDAGVGQVVAGEPDAGRHGLAGGADRGVVAGPGDGQAASASKDVFEERLGRSANQLGSRLAG